MKAKENETNEYLREEGENFVFNKNSKLSSVKEI